MDFCLSIDYNWIFKGHLFDILTVHVIGESSFTNQSIFKCLSSSGLSSRPSMMTSSNGNLFRVTGEFSAEFPAEFPSQRPVTRSFDVFFDLRLNKRLSKQSRRWWFKTPSWSIWRHCDASLLLNVDSDSELRLRQRFIQHKITQGSFTSRSHYKTVRTYWTNMNVT